MGGVGRRRRPTLRVAVLAGAGKVFCAGADLAWMSKMVGLHARGEPRATRARWRACSRALDRLPIPLIGRVHGAALGGGAGLAAVCDIVVAAEDAVVRVHRGEARHLPAVISPFVLAKIGRSAARELFLTGARFSRGARAGDRPGARRRAARELDAIVGEVRERLLTSAPEARRGGESADRAKCARRGPARRVGHDRRRDRRAARVGRRPGRPARVPREAEAVAGVRG